MKGYLVAVLVLLAGVGTGRADDEAVIAELDKAGVTLIEERLHIGPREGMANCKFRPNYADFKNVQGTNTLLDRVAQLSNIEELALRLAGSDLMDEGLATLGCRRKGLATLDLKNTVVTDKGLKSLAGVSVSYLNLSGCAGVTDAGLESIARLKGLEVVVLAGTRVTTDGVASLKKALPDCNFILDKD
jgi:hypothetical protein